MENQKNSLNDLPLSREAVADVINAATRVVAEYCAKHSLPPHAVINLLFTAAGSYGWSLPNRQILIDELQKFIHTAQRIMPSAVLNGLKVDRQSEAIVTEIVMEERKQSVVH